MAEDFRWIFWYGYGTDTVHIRISISYVFLPILTCEIIGISSVSEYILIISEGLRMGTGTNETAIADQIPGQIDF